MAGVIAVQVLAVVFGLVSIGLIVWAGTRLGRRLMDATPPRRRHGGQPHARPQPRRRRGRTRAVGRASPPRPAPPGPAQGVAPPGVAACAALGLGWSIPGRRSPARSPQAVSPRHRPGGRLRSDRGRGCRHRVLGDHRGAARATRVALVALAAVLVALAVAAVVAPPVESGSQVVGVGRGLWLCLAGSLALLGAALLALSRPAAASAPEE